MVRLQNGSSAQESYKSDIALMERFQRGHQPIIESQSIQQEPGSEYHLQENEIVGQLNSHCQYKACNDGYTLCCSVVVNYALNTPHRFLNYWNSSKFLG